MQAAVPFTWEEWPGKAKRSSCSSQLSGSSLQPCASTGNYDFKKACSLQDLFSRDNSSDSAIRSSNAAAALSLAPPPGGTPCSGMSTSSSGSSELDGTSGFSSAAESLPGSQHEQEQQQQLGPRSRSVTLLDLMRAMELDESKTLEGLFRSEAAQAKRVLLLQSKHDTVAPPAAPAVHVKKSRRSSYLPYKPGLISIFCMSPYTEELVLAHSKKNRRAK